MSGDVIIVGNGQAGCQLAASLREAKFDGGISLVGAEPGPPYQKPPLSKGFLSGALAEADLALKPLAFFANKQIDWIEDQALEIDRAGRAVRLARGGWHPYGDLVLATGAENRMLPVPGHHLAGVVTLRSRADAIVLRHLLASVPRIVIIGAGFIGLEVASAARHLGVEVIVVEREDRVLARAVSATTAGFLQSYHQGQGVQFHLPATVDHFAAADGALGAVHLTDGRVIPTALALVAIGVAPVNGLAMAAGLPLANGIAVDALLTTPDPAIHAIGDGASYPHALFGERRMRLESVQNAMDHARCLARTLTGTPTPYARLPWFWSHQGDMRLQIAGVADAGDESILRGDPAAGRFTVFRLHGGRVVAAESINQASDHMLSRQLVQAGQVADPAALRDLHRPLKTLAQAKMPALIS